MPQLTANYSEALTKLLRSNDAPIDGIEVGPWFTPQKIKQLQQEYYAWKFQFHAGSFITRYQYLKRGALKRVSEYLACTQSQWLSLHIELLPVLIFVTSNRFGLHLNPFEFEKARNKFIRLLTEIKDSVQLPILLENLPSLPQGKYVYAADPSVISEIVTTTGSGFLLDISHARAAASYQGMSVEQYLEKLPLERTVQIHVSGAREKAGHFQDAHEVLQEEDYVILEWVLQRCQPKVITLEYFRELGNLREQLWKLRDIISRRQGVCDWKLP